MEITPKDISTQALQVYLQSSISPRPIALASTIDENGNPNLSPFSFFNMFSTNPPICIFSPARRVRNNTNKHTLFNCENTKEVVINLVSYDMVQQTSLASCEYGDDVDEFKKSGLTPVPSTVVKPFRVKESPVQLECKVLEIKALGEEGGAGNLVICEIVKIHINDNVLDENGQIDPHKIDLVARMGQNFYCRASGDAVFEVPKPNTQLGIGVDQLPEHVRNSEILTGNDLGILGNSTEIPSVPENYADNRLREIHQKYGDNRGLLLTHIHQYAKELIKRKEVDAAWQVLLSY